MSRPKTDAETIAYLIRKIQEIGLLETQIRGQMAEILAINKALREENARLRDLISRSKFTRMTLLQGGQKDGDSDQKPTDNHDGPSDGAS